MSYELFVTYNSDSLFLELLAEYTQTTQRGIIKVAKMRETTINSLKLPEMPFIINNVGEIVSGEVQVSEIIARAGGCYEVLFGSNKDDVYKNFDFIKNAKEQINKDGYLTFLNNLLLTNTFCNGFHITVSDIYAYAHAVVNVQLMTDADKWVNSNIIRWIDHLQSLKGIKEKIVELKLRVSLPYEPLFLEPELKAKKEKSNFLFF